MTNATGLPISTGVAGLGTGVATALAAAVTGSGGPVLATAPSITAPKVFRTVTTTYTASGAIATSDSFSLINSATAVAMTVAAGTVDGQPLIINNYGAGTATVTLTLQGVSTPVSMPSGSVLNVSWNVALSTYPLTS